MAKLLMDTLCTGITVISEIAHLYLTIRNQTQNEWIHILPLLPSETLPDIISKKRLQSNPPHNTINHF